MSKVISIRLQDEVYAALELEADATFEPQLQPRSGPATLAQDVISTALGFELRPVGRKLRWVKVDTPNVEKGGPH